MPSRARPQTVQPPTEDVLIVFESGSDSFITWSLQQWQPSIHDATSGDRDIL